MWCSRRVLAAAALAVLLAISSCGYRFSSAAPLALPKNMKRLYLEEIQDPTTQPQLEPRLRSSLRNEFTQRGGAEWVSREEAEGLFRVKIFSYTSSSKLESAEQETVRFEAVIRFQGRIFQSGDQSLVWESGRLTARESYARQSERDSAQQEVVRRAAEKLANQLAQGF